MSRSETYSLDVNLFIEVALWRNQQSKLGGGVGKNISSLSGYQLGLQDANTVSTLNRNHVFKNQNSNSIPKKLRNL